MDRQQIISTLQKFEPDLRARGVRHAALFGSVARGTAGPESDIDIMIDLDPAAGLDVYAYAGLKRFVAERFTGSVEVVNREALRPSLRPPAEAKAFMLSKMPENRLLHIRDAIDTRARLHRRHVL